MSKLDDEVRFLLPELARLSNGELDALATVVRAKLPKEVAKRLDEKSTGLSGIALAVTDTKTLQQLDSATAGIAMRAWVEAAKHRLDSGFEARFAARRDSLDQLGRDPAIGKVAERAKVELHDDLVDISWLAHGAVAAAAVGYLEVPRFDAGARTGAIAGTGFLVSQDRRHVMTACHVIEAREIGEPPPAKADLEAQLRESSIAFDYVSHSGKGTPIALEAVVAADRTLDYAIVRLAAPIAAEPLVLFTGALPKIDRDIGFAANIVQHPLRDQKPQPKQLGLRNNAVWKIDDPLLYYFTDTRSGSSGAPVFSDGWKVIAVHTGYDTFSKAEYLGRTQGFANRGTLIREVVKHSAKPLAGANVVLVLE